MNPRFTPARSLSALALSFMLAACGGGSDSAPQGNGTLKLGLTDAPSCGYDEVNVTVQKVRVHRSATANDNDSGWYEIDLNKPATPSGRRLDLLELSNGVIEELGETPLPAGTYTQMRLVLAANGGAAPYANSVVPTGSAETPLTTPSAQQSGLKLKDVHIVVQPGEVADFVIDFDACKSIVKRGNSGHYNLKPVIAVIPRVSANGMRVVGWIDPAVAATTSVSVQQDGVPVKATLANRFTGRFDLYPVPAGDYTLVISGGGRINAVMTGVPVVNTGFTYVNREAQPITLPSALLRPVDGSVLPVTASVRALQRLAGGTVYEAAWAPVDADFGSFGFDLPIGSPMTALYSLSATPTFTVDTSPLGVYTIEAASNGAILAQDVDVDAPVDPLAFVFP